MHKLIDFFKDKQGRFVIAQMPNLPLIGWLVFTILNLLWTSHQPKVHSLFSMLSFGFIFTWAWLEITTSVNGFRRTFGLLVLIVTVYLYI